MRYPGYEMKTTFHQDFAIAEAFGTDAVRDTYERAFDEWHGNVEYITELSMVLNHRLWLHYEKGETALADLYDVLWRELDAWCIENFKGEDASYYFNITD